MTTCQCKTCQFYCANPVPDSDDTAQDGTPNSGVRKGEIPLVRSAMLCTICRGMAGKFVNCFRCSLDGNHVMALDGRAFEDLGD